MKKRIIILLLIFAIGTAFMYPNMHKIKKIAETVLKTYSFEDSNTNINNISENNTDDYVWGIDISRHQKKIDWETLVKKKRPDFIIFKATEGTTLRDKKYTEYSNVSKKLGIKTGAYHFFSYRSDGKSQAKNFISHSKLKNGDLFPVLDVERKRFMKSKKWMIAEIKVFCNEIKKEYGVYPIIYCTSRYYHKYFKEDFPDFNYWIADYKKEPDIDYFIWQYTESGFVDGIGEIDNNILNEDKDLSEIIISNYSQTKNVD